MNLSNLKLAIACGGVQIFANNNVVMTPEDIDAFATAIIAKDRAQRQAGQELFWCGCGDGYPPESFEAGVMSVSGQCSNCNMAAAPQPAVERKPLTDEQDRALCEAYCNTASDEYFSARPQLDCAVNRRIFYAGHRKCWIEKAAHGITATQGATHDK